MESLSNSDSNNKKTKLHTIIIVLFPFFERDENEIIASMKIVKLLIKTKTGAR